MNMKCTLVAQNYYLIASFHNVKTTLLCFVNNVLK